MLDAEDFASVAQSEARWLTLLLRMPSYRFPLKHGRQSSTRITETYTDEESMAKAFRFAQMAHRFGNRAKGDQRERGSWPATRTLTQPLGEAGVRRVSVSISVDKKGIQVNMMGRRMFLEKSAGDNGDDAFLLAGVLPLRGLKASKSDFSAAMPIICADPSAPNSQTLFEADQRNPISMRAKELSLLMK